MRAWKGVLFMWSALAILVFTVITLANPAGTWVFITNKDNAQVVGLIMGIPMFIFLFWLMKNMFDSGPKPDQWWKDDDRSSF